MQNFTSGKGPKKFSYTSRKEKIRLRLIDDECTPENLGLSEFSDTDVEGSYTGVPKNKKEKPVQDADDL
ncbi:MAG: hypothetical protein K6D98_05445 [Clostridiales bacterium]|nr:hypothetical protein [Clostridiales bacterium]